MAKKTGVNGQAPPPPPFRRLQIFSFDPSIDTSLLTANVSRSVVSVRWEKDLKSGPVGEYVEVVDIDPSSACVYDPVELSAPHLLAQDGLAPSTGNPQFHQQMVYAVIMLTVHNFEKALGRPVYWAERTKDDADKYIKDPGERYVRRLRVYPHALREENAYYSPVKRALLFGYFNATTSDPREEMPGGVVFTCLSQHIVAHETTHAILDGLYPRLLEPTNDDMLAFHEAFGDIVAIFQTFTLPGVLINQIQSSRGDLRGTNHLLSKLATQFARSTGRGGALRDALDVTERTGRPDPTVLAKTREPHGRGAILVAAVFDAFLQMYEKRVADLRRIATNGTGVLPEGDIHPDLARRFAEEAGRLSERVLTICIRALDYLPPVDVTFGDFLRALITSDSDFFPDDRHRYRLAFLDAFRNRGIYPADVRVLGEDTLRWRQLSTEEHDLISKILPSINVLRSMASSFDSDQALQDFANSFDIAGSFTKKARAAKGTNSYSQLTTQFIEACWGEPRICAPPETHANGARYARFLAGKCFAKFLNWWLVAKFRELAAEDRNGRDVRAKIGECLGIDIDAIKEGGGRLEVHAIRPTVRLQSDGRTKVELLVILTQRISLFLPQDGPLSEKSSDKGAARYKFRGGCTLILCPEEGWLRYAIRKSVCSGTRRARQADFLREQSARHGPTALDRFRLKEHENADNETKRQQRDRLREEATKELFAFVHRECAEGDSIYG